MQPHQQRVLFERQALAGNVDRLAAFIAHNAVFSTLPFAEQDRMTRQLAHMTAYLGVLDERIAAFA
jgi:hypothetical protein